jgi:hypothetical protein
MLSRWPEPGGDQQRAQLTTSRSSEPAPGLRCGGSIEDVWCCFDNDHARPGAPLFRSERRKVDGSAPGCVGWADV